MQFKTKLTLELGRSIAASCGAYLTSVVDKKTNKGQNYAIVDGGMHQLVYYGQSMAMKHPFVHELTPRMDAETEPWNICGSLCTINDILVKQLPMRRPTIGDVLVFENAGAYCAAEGIALFLSRDLPAVMLLKNGHEPVCARTHMPTELLNTPNDEMR
ncbi:L-glutamyl-[BtrI acyl-carrier protein] decarboxylase [bioreactor metagenome]|uniref:L-glutamyl-[BtrI acyl-carrier protein] decarboxylase n=1 Tax=bioreactor metagenome TaxID=1076179 RepID=A0A645G0W2_9ZZZZ